MTIETILASIIAFATTNIDDIFILILFFSDSKIKGVNVILGQFIGISTLISISIIGSFIGFLIDLKYVGLLGMVPIYIGVKSAISLLKNSLPEKYEANIRPTANSGKHIQESLFVAAITIVNGGDNISIYILLYAVLTNSGKVTMTIIFLLMTALWCLLAKYLSNHPVVKKSVEKYGHLIIPFVFILLGIYIMYESNTFDLVQ